MYCVRVTDMPPCHDDAGLRCQAVYFTYLCTNLMEVDGHVRWVHKLRAITPAATVRSGRAALVNDAWNWACAHSLTSVCNDGDMFLVMDFNPTGGLEDIPRQWERNEQACGRDEAAMEHRERDEM